MFCFLQINITIENVEMVVNNLTEIVTMTAKPSDKNADNIKIISIVIVEVASLLGQTSVEGNLEPEVIQMVSCTELAFTCHHFNYYLFNNK